MPLRAKPDRLFAFAGKRLALVNKLLHKASEMPGPTGHHSEHGRLRFFSKSQVQSTPGELLNATAGLDQHCVLASYRTLLALVRGLLLTMANKSSVLRVLEKMGGEQLRSIARSRGLPTSGSIDALAKRITVDCKRDLSQLVNAACPLNRNDWNDLVVKNFNGARRRSFEEVIEEIERGLDGAANNRLSELQSQTLTVSDLRRDRGEAEHLAMLLGTTPRKLLNFLRGANGNRSVARIAAQLIQRFQPRDDDSGDDEHDDFAALLDDADDDDEGPTSSAPVRDRDRAKVSASAPSSRPPPRVTQSLPKPPIGHLLNGRWRILRVVGEGGMGTAYEVTNERNMTRVAKVAHSDGGDSEALRREELVLERDLAHKNVCHYYDFARDRQYGDFVVMQHCGRSLQSIYAKKGAEVDEAIRLLEQAAAGLDYLHDHDIVHGDVNPGNILLDDAGTVRLTDFGAASTLREVNRTHGKTRAGELYAKHPFFAAEEVIRGQAPRRASDQASLARVFCSLLTGVDRFAGEPRVKFSRLGSAQAVLDKALGDSRQRHKSCMEFVRLLRKEVG